MRYALGVGCSRFCPPEELIALVNSTLAEAGLSIYEVAGIWSLDLKADEAAIHALADNLGVSARFFDATTLEQETPRLSAPSERVFKEVGCHGVAEGAALAAAGPDAELTVTKRRSASATCAVARIGQGGANGRPRGRLAIVGIGPGQSDWRTPEASRLIAESDEIVGYRLYLDLLCPLAKSRSQKTFPLGAEEERCRYALDRAGEGRKVALVCSGDAGIYAMGALVMELLENSRDGTDLSTAARRVEIISVPGITAMQAASARAGALLGHDFCAISLSDLMTPRDTILSRVRAAAEGDFVIAFYNPVSKRRRTLLDEAKRLLLRHRPAETPVILSTSVGRCDERHQATTLGQLSSEAADMLTVVLVGSSTSRAVWLGDQAAGIAGQMFFTPRGYLDKGAVLSA